MQVPDGFAVMIAHAIDLLVLLGAAAMAVIAYKLGRTKPPEKAPDRVLLDSVRDDIAEDGKTQQTAIEDALTGDDPANALAKLGNERRS